MSQCSIATLQPWTSLCPPLVEVAAAPRPDKNLLSHIPGDLSIFGKINTSSTRQKEKSTRKHWKHLKQWQPVRTLLPWVVPKSTPKMCYWVILFVFSVLRVVSCLAAMTLCTLAHNGLAIGYRTSHFLGTGWSDAWCPNLRPFIIGLSTNPMLWRCDLIHSDPSLPESQKQATSSKPLSLSQVKIKFIISHTKQQLQPTSNSLQQTPKAFYVFRWNRMSGRSENPSGQGLAWQRVPNGYSFHRQIRFNFAGRHNCFGSHRTRALWFWSLLPWRWQVRLEDAVTWYFSSTRCRNMALNFKH